MRLAQLVEEPVEGQRLPVHGGAARVRHVDQVAVVVPLEEGDVVLVEQRQQLVAHVGVGRGHLEVEHLLVPPLRRQLAATAQHPLGVGAHQVGVDGDHLGLHPEPEVEAETPHVVDQRVQALGPHVRVDDPVAEPPQVVAAAEHPAVVEHEPLGADLRGGVRQGGERGEVVVEVDGLPGVDQHRAGTPGARRVPAQPRVLPVGDAVEAVAGPGGDQPGRVVALARGEHDLAGAEQLAAAEQALPRRRPLGVGLVVTAPGHVGGPHLAVAEAEAGLTGDQQQGGVVAGAAVAPLAQVGALEPRTTLRGALAAPPAGEVEQLGGAGGDRERAADRAQHEVAVAGVRDAGAQAEQALAGELDVDGDVPAGLGVDRAQRDRRVVGPRGDGGLPGPQPRRPGSAGGGTGPVPLERGQAGEAGRRLAHQSAQPRPVERGVGHAGSVGLDERRERLVVERAERRAPVQDGWLT